MEISSSSTQNVTSGMDKITTPTKQFAIEVISKILSSYKLLEKEEEQTKYSEPAMLAKQLLTQIMNGHLLAVEALQNDVSKYIRFIIPMVVPGAAKDWRIIVKNNNLLDYKFEQLTN